MVVNEKIPKKLWTLLTLEQSGSFGGLEEER
jgi:hypothetical protein